MEKCVCSARQTHLVFQIVDVKRKTYYATLMFCLMSFRVFNQVCSVLVNQVCNFQWLHNSSIIMGNLLLYGTNQRNPICQKLLIALETFLLFLPH